MTQHPITLAPTIARCPNTRIKDCGQSSNCARALVPHSKSRPVQDYSIEPKIVFYGKANCQFWLDAAMFRRAPEAAVGTVHEAPEGLK